MPQYVIEREMPGAGKLDAEDLKMASQTSCSALDELGPKIQWYIPSRLFSGPNHGFQILHHA